MVGLVVLIIVVKSNRDVCTLYCNVFVCRVLSYEHKGLWLKFKLRNKCGGNYQASVSFVLL